MTKKNGFLMCLVISILGIGSTFADVIDPDTHYVDRCVKLQNVEIDDYRVIVENDTVTTRDVYEPKVEECLAQHYKFGESRQYLLDKSINIEEVTKENIQDMAIQIGDLQVNGRYVDNSNPLSDENFMYKLVKDGDSYTLEISESEQGIELVNDSKVIKFGLSWLLTVIIETIILFVIAKLFRKRDKISNLRLILVGVLASTITLPLLWFVLPLFIVDGVEYVVVGELLVTLIEIFIIKYGLKISRGKAILASVICNLCSYLLGLLILW